MSVTPPFANPFRQAIGLLGAAGVLVIGMLALMQSLPPAAPKETSAGARDSRRCTLRPDGYLRGRFFGALNITANWSGANLLCDGMQRPNGDGLRLFFARELPGVAGVSVLIGIDGRLEDMVGTERPANVTVIDEQGGRFFGTGGPGRCWASINSIKDLPRAAGGKAGFRIDGLVYCMGALPSVGDRASLTLSELQFAGRISPDDA